MFSTKTHRHRILRSVFGNLNQINPNISPIELVTVIFHLTLYFVDNF
jgi:hypothetical protein